MMIVRDSKGKITDNFDTGTLDVDATQSGTEGAFLEMTPAHLQPGEVGFDLSTRAAALKTIALFYNNNKEVGEPNFDLMFSTNNLGFKPARSLKNSLREYGQNILDGSIPSREDGTIMHLTKEGIGNFYRNEDWETLTAEADNRKFVAISNYQRGFTEIIVDPDADAAVVDPDADAAVVDPDAAVDTVLSGLASILYDEGIKDKEKTTSLNFNTAQLESDVDAMNPDHVRDDLRPALQNIFEVTDFNASLTQPRHNKPAETQWTNLTDSDFETPDEAFTVENLFNSQIVVDTVKAGKMQGLEGAVVRTNEDGSPTEQLANSILAGNLTQDAVVSAASGVYSLQPLVTQEDTTELLNKIATGLTNTFKIENGVLLYNRDGSMLGTNAEGKFEEINYTANKRVAGTGLGGRSIPLPVQRLLSELGGLMGNKTIYLNSKNEIQIDKLQSWLTQE